MTDGMLRDDLETLLGYEDDSHLIRMLQRCKTCGQLYFYEFHEEIDWVDGNDPQYRSWIPVEDEESARELSRLGPFGAHALPRHPLRLPFQRQHTLRTAMGRPPVAAPPLPACAAD